MSRTRRLVILAALIGLWMCAALPGLAQHRADTLIDVAGEAASDSCRPCHARIAESRTNGLLFRHGAHLTVACWGCHWEPPHLGGAAVRPSMDPCFICHGLEHGSKGSVARDSCDLCHTAEFELRPRDHVEDWAAKPHAEAANGVSASCVMCHEPSSDCDRCHVEMEVDVRPISPVFLPVLPILDDGPAVYVDVVGPTSSEQCTSCHLDIDAPRPARAERIFFQHEEHLEHDERCELCHVGFGHRPEGVVRPEMQRCDICHGAEAASLEIFPIQECTACHPVDFELKPGDHTGVFQTALHKGPAADDVTYCDMCHQANYCVECHLGRRERVDGTSHRKVVPIEHKASRDWDTVHGGTYLAQSDDCRYCHDSGSCAQCHYTTMPHPPGWREGHEAPEDREARDCGVCHTDRDSCQRCHHEALLGAELKEANCTECHPEMAQKPATAIGRKVFAEHAVHFGVDIPEGAYRCPDCHVSFGADAGSYRGVLDQEGHALALCAECHGTARQEGASQAPLVDVELCRACHEDLSL